MKLNYKILSFLLAILLTIAIFTGCTENFLDTPVDSESSGIESSEQDIHSETESEENVSSDTVSESEDGSKETETSDTASETNCETSGINREETSVETESVAESETIPPLVIYEEVNSPSSHKPATSYEEALERTNNYQLSGYDYVPDQAPILSEYRPMQDGKYVKNTNSYYADYNTYVVVDVYGREVFRLYRGGAYITLEEVAAYVYAFGT